jgi:Capsular polysaccharide synthesis protein
MKALAARMAGGIPAFGRFPRRAADPQPAPALPKIIWMLWHQGWDQAPAIAHAARRSWAGRNPEWELRALDRTSLATFLPAATMEDIYGKPKEQESMANLVRMELLYRHGGVWADATTLCLRPLDDWLPAAMPRGFFAFDRPAENRMLATWFLASLPQNNLVGTWRNVMNAYWQGRDARHVYFWMHGLFAQCYENDPVFRAIWDGTPRLSARHPFHFGPDSPALLAAPRGDLGVDLAALLANPPAPVFKLTHKFTTPPQPGSLFCQLCDLVGGV